MIEKLAVIALWGYVAWMLVAGRSVWWGDRDHPNTFWMNSRWVYRAEEVGFYWAAVAFHVLLGAAMTYIAFFK